MDIIEFRESAARASDPPATGNPWGPPEKKPASVGPVEVTAESAADKSASANQPSSVFVAGMNRLARSNPKGLVSMLDQVCVSGTRFLVTIIIARACGVSPMGQFAIAQSLIMFGLISQQSLVMTPLTNFIHRATASQRRIWAGTAFCLAMILCVCVMLVLGLIGLAIAAFGDAATGLVVMAAMTAVLPCGVVEYIRRYAYAIERPRLALWIDFAVSLLVLFGLGICWINSELTAGRSFYVIAIANLLIAGSWLLFAAKDHLSFTISRLRTAKMFRFGRWVFASEFALYLKSYSYVWLVGLFWGLSGAGFFSACMSLMRAANPVLLGIANITEPALARSFAHSGSRQVGRLAIRLSLVLALAMMPICLLLALTSHELLRHLFGPEYAAYWPTAVVLSVATFTGAVGYPLGNALQAIHRPRLAFDIRLYSLLFAILVALILIPWFGVLGAAIAALTGSIFSILLRLFVFNRQFRCGAFDNALKGGI